MTEVFEDYVSEEGQRIVLARRAELEADAKGKDSAADGIPMVAAMLALYAKAESMVRSPPYSHLSLSVTCLRDQSLTFVFSFQSFYHVFLCKLVKK